MVFALFGVLVTMGFGSIPAQVFAPTVTPWKEGTTCAEGLRAQANALRSLSIEHTHAAFSGSMLEPAGRALRDWDSLQAGLERICSSELERKAHHQLDVLRHRLETSLDRMDRGDKPLLESLRRLEAN